jgi:hypothetical protein
VWDAVCVVMVCEGLALNSHVRLEFGEVGGGGEGRERGGDTKAETRQFGWREERE